MPRKLDLTVVGGPQHVIAKTAFTKLPTGDDIDGQLDYQQVKVTLAIAENRFCEGVYPSTPPAADVVRRLVVDLGEDFHQDDRVFVDPAFDDGVHIRQREIDDSPPERTLPSLPQIHVARHPRPIRWMVFALLCGGPG